MISGLTNSIDEALTAVGEEFGKVLGSAAFSNEKDLAPCAAFLRERELTLNDRALSREHKLLNHAAITAAQHDRHETVVHVTGPSTPRPVSRMETVLTITSVAGCRLLRCSWVPGGRPPGDRVAARRGLSLVWLLGFMNTKNSNTQFLFGRS